MGYKVFEKSAYEPRKGLEGPFHYPNGRVLYYDPKAGKNWDPRTDFYVEYEEGQDLMGEIFTRISA